MESLINNLPQNTCDSAEFRRALQTICQLGYLSKDELRLLLWLYANGGSLINTWQREIARELRMHRASLNRIIKNLGGLGIIKREDVREEYYTLADFQTIIKKKVLNLTFSVSGTIAYAKSLADNYVTWQNQEILESLGTVEEARAKYDKRINIQYWRRRWQLILKSNPEAAGWYKEIGYKLDVKGKSFDCDSNGDPKIVLFKPSIPVDEEVWEVAQYVWRSDNFEKWNYNTWVMEIMQRFEDVGYYRKYRESLGLKSGIISRFERDW